MAGTSAKALLKGINTWQKETMLKKVVFSLTTCLYFLRTIFGLQLFDEAIQILLEFQEAEKQQASESKPAGE